LTTQNISVAKWLCSGELASRAAWVFRDGLDSAEEEESQGNAIQRRGSTGLRAFYEGACFSLSLGREDWILLIVGNTGTKMATSWVFLTTFLSGSLGGPKSGGHRSVLWVHFFFNSSPLELKALNVFWGRVKGYCRMQGVLQNVGGGGGGVQPSTQSYTCLSTIFQGNILANKQASKQTDK
jgi:hypothetical protein